jgi:hypothetical protein
MKSGKRPAKRCANVAVAVTATIRRRAEKADAMAIAAPRVVVVRMVRTAIVDRKKRDVAQVPLMANVVPKAVAPKVAGVMGVEVLAIQKMTVVPRHAVRRLAAHKRVAPKVVVVRIVRAADAKNQTSKRSSCGLISMAMAC